MGRDIPLFVLRSDELKPIKGVPIWIFIYEFSPFGAIVRTDRSIPGLSGNHGVREMNVRMNKALGLGTGGANPTGIGQPPGALFGPTRCRTRSAGGPFRQLFIDLSAHYVLGKSQRQGQSPAAF